MDFKMQKYIERESAELKRCPSRAKCPIGMLCCEASTHKNPLIPVVKKLEQEDLLWTNLHLESRVFVLKSGLYVCLATEGESRTIPFGLYGSGIAIGLMDIYLSESMSDTYYLKTLVAGEVCSVPAKVLKHHIESLPVSYFLSLVNANATNQTIASLMQTRIATHRLLQDRVLLLFFLIRHLLHQEDESFLSLPLTHSDISLLVSADRASITRTLKSLKESGSIELGRRHIEVRFDKIMREDLEEEAFQEFFTVQAPVSGATSR